MHPPQAQAQLQPLRGKKGRHKAGPREELEWGGEPAEVVEIEDEGDESEGGGGTATIEAHTVEARYEEEISVALGEISVSLSALFDASMVAMSKWPSFIASTSARSPSFKGRREIGKGVGGLGCKDRGAILFRDQEINCGGGGGDDGWYSGCMRWQE